MILDGQFLVWLQWCQMIKFLVWLQVQWCEMNNSSCDFSDARRKNPGVTTNFSYARWIIPCVTSVMPEEKILVWPEMTNSLCDFSDARRKNPGLTTKFSDARWTIPHVTMYELFEWCQKMNSQCDNCFEVTLYYVYSTCSDRCVNKLKTCY